VERGVFDLARKGLNSMIILGAWMIWNHRNRCVCYGDPPNLARALFLSGEMYYWSLAGGLRAFHSFLPLSL
jgi:hypothetical protein